MIGFRRKSAVTLKKLRYSNIESGIHEVLA